MQIHLNWAMVLTGLTASQRATSSARYTADFQREPQPEWGSLFNSLISGECKQSFHCRVSCFRLQDAAVILQQNYNMTRQSQTEKSNRSQTGFILQEPGRKWIRKYVNHVTNKITWKLKTIASTSLTSGKESLLIRLRLDSAA